MSQNVLPRFLKTAEALKIRGLTDGMGGNRKETSTSAKENTSEARSNSSPPPEKRKRRHSGSIVARASPIPNNDHQSDSQVCYRGISLSALLSMLNWGIVMLYSAAVTKAIPVKRPPF